jgi:lipid-binding SYLF domain-containing protein
MAAGSLTLGGNMSLAVGPLGRNGEAATALNTQGKLAAMCVHAVVLVTSLCPMSFQV